VSLKTRKVTFRLYLTCKQLKKLELICWLHRQLYNAALQQRIEAYQRQRLSLSFADQCRELTKLRAECPEYEALNAQSCQVTLKRLDLAFQHFFRRIKEGAKQPGFPRFKSANRFKGFGYKSHGDGFKVISEGKHGALRITGVGLVKIRGRARDWGKIAAAEIYHKTGRWYLSVTIKCEAKRSFGKKAQGLDWGVETFATLADSEGNFQEIKNPRFLKKSLKKLKSAQKSVCRKKLGSKNRKKASKKVAHIHAKVTNQRNNFLHQISAKTIQESALIATESLNVKGMTASGGEHKKGLNREILNTAPARYISILKYKAEEAGTVWKEIPTREVKPSQRCSGCGQIKKKQLSERWHKCSVCNLELSRDQNSARVMLSWALVGNASGWEAARCGEPVLAGLRKQETPAIVTAVTWR
jgi:putative transposase